MTDTPLTNALGRALLHFLWQGSLIALLAWLMLRRLRRPTVRYLIAIGGLALMPLSLAVTTTLGLRPAPPVHPPLTDLVWTPTGLLNSSTDRTATDRQAESPSVPGSPSAPLAVTPATVAANAGASDPASSAWLPLLVLFWLAGVVVLSIRLLGGWTAARRLVRDGTVPARAEYQRLFALLVERLKVSPAVRLLESSIASVPSVVGWVRPVILLPAAALTGLTPAQIELLLAHELAHVRRHDYLVNLLQCAVETLLFYHPAAWWLSRKAREERELCCDDIAVGITGDARQYAEALVALERMRVGPALAMAATGGALLPRIRRLLDVDAPQVEIFPRWIAGGLVVSLLAVGAAGLGLPQLNPLGRVPQSADPLPAVSKDTAIVPSDQGAVVAAPAMDTVIAHPDPGRPLAERIAWATTRGKADRNGYYVVYTVEPVDQLRGSIFVGHGIFYSHSGDKTSFSGTVVNIGDAGNFNAPGTRLATILPGPPDQVAIILSYRGERVDEAAGVSLTLPYDFHSRPIYWLGPADQSQSVEQLRTRFDRGSTVDLRVMMVRLIGLHKTSDQVLSFLIGVLQGNDSVDVRKQAADWLGYHPTRRSLDALEAIARRDRSREVRRKAAEAVGELDMPEAFDVLVKLARELDDAEVRRKAVEALGDRSESGAARVLDDIARHDRDEDVERKATEALGELSDNRGLESLRGLVADHPLTDVRRKAVETFADAAAVDQAVELLDRVIRIDPSEDVRRKAVDALVDLHDGKGMDIVKKMAREHQDPVVRRQAVEDLPDHLPVEEAIPFLRDVIARDPSADVRRKAVESLADLKDDRSLPILLEIARSADRDDVARKAVEALGDIDAPAALDGLVQIARSGPSEEIMVRAVEALGNGKSDRGLSAVADIAAAHPRGRVRAKAVESYAENASGQDALTLFRKLVATERDDQVLRKLFESAIELDGVDGVGFVIEVVKSNRDTYVRDVAVRKLKDSDDRRARALLRDLGQGD